MEQTGRASGLPGTAQHLGKRIKSDELEGRGGCIDRVPFSSRFF